MTVHLLKSLERHSWGLWATAWCGESTLGMQVVAEAFFSDCAECSTARARAASAVKPTSELPAVIVPPYPVNPHG